MEVGAFLDSEKTAGGLADLLGVSRASDVCDRRNGTKAHRLINKALRKVKPVRNTSGSAQKYRTHGSVQHVPYLVYTEAYKIRIWPAGRRNTPKLIASGK